MHNYFTKAVAALTIIFWLTSLSAAEEPARHKWFTEPEHTPHDTWGMVHKGEFYLFYQARENGTIDMIRSKDGVHWQEQGVIIKQYPGTIKTGTGCIWKSPEFESNGLFIMSWKLVFSHNEKYEQFSTSSDLLAWGCISKK